MSKHNKQLQQFITNFLRLVVHTLAAIQFVYGLHYHYYYVRWPKHEEHVLEDLKTRWGGKFKYLTFLNVIIQGVYHLLALANDIFGSNGLRSNSKLRLVRDYIFAAWAFPLALNVSTTFWSIYAWNREFIFPSVLDAIFPNWLNHVVHTNVGLFAVMDLLTCFRRYPTRLAGIIGNISFMLLYVIWMHIVRYFSGVWVYPLLEVLNLPLRYLVLSGLVAFNLLCYFIGEYANNYVWAAELRPVVKMHKLKQS